VQSSAALAILTTDFGPDTSGDSTEVHGFSMQMKTCESVHGGGECQEKTREKRFNVAEFILYPHDGWKLLYKRSWRYSKPCV
jgi:hypothetical protein